MTRRRFVLALALLACTAGLVLAGNPHFVFTTTTVTGDTVTVSGKIAGLGNEEQVHVVLNADAECVNRGGHNPSAANKDALVAAGDFPVQNGKATFSLSATADFQPDCSPPMELRITNVIVCDTTSGISSPPGEVCVE